MTETYDPLPTKEYKPRTIPHEAPKTRDYDRDTVLPRLDLDRLADDLILWFSGVLDYLHPDNWTFSVYEGKRGSTERPKDFRFLWDDCRGSIRLGLPVKDDYLNTVELGQRREAIHQTVSHILWRAIGVPGTNKRLKELREQSRLQPVRRVKDDE